MKFIIIDPAVRKFERVDVKDAGAAYALVGLKPGAVDHGVLMPLADGGGIGYAVYEFCFFVPASQQSYFALNGTLMAGPVVLYQYDEGGHTVDLGDTVLKNRWFDGAAQVEYLISRGVLVRPQIKVNGEVVWSWPEPAPADLADRVVADRPRPRDD